MSYVNKVFLIGRLGSDPQVKQTASGSQIVNFSIATNSRRKSKDGGFQDHTEWHNLVAFNREADTLTQYARKGTLIYIEGSLRTNSWEKNGVRHYKTEIVVNKFQFLGNSDSNTSNYQTHTGQDNVFTSEIEDDVVPF